MRPVVFGCSGPVLSDAEKDFFRAADPFGFVLFQRNCISPQQVRELARDLRLAVGRQDALVFIDEEGGRVSRLKPPHWPCLPPLRSIGETYERDKAAGLEAMAAHSQAIADRLVALGINGNFAPVLDLFFEGASSAIGDRAASRDPDAVAALARTAISTFKKNGVLPVVKHLPGHGRVAVDPHLQLPVVGTSLAELKSNDFAPFRAVADCAEAGMNCHVVFTAIDDSLPVSLSEKAHREIIRGDIGFKGLLFSDDLAMKALSGELADLALRALAAGADIALYCAGDLEEMRKIAAAVPETSVPTVCLGCHS